MLVVTSGSMEHLQALEHDPYRFPSVCICMYEEAMSKLHTRHHQNQEWCEQNLELVDLSVLPITFFLLFVVVLAYILCIPFLLILCGQSLAKSLPHCFMCD